MMFEIVNIISIITNYDFDNAEYLSIIYTYLQKYSKEDQELWVELYNYTIRWINKEKK